MECFVYSMNNLFVQFGQFNDDVVISCFIESYCLLVEDIWFYEVVFWIFLQVGFLCDVLVQDVDWVEVVDELNVCLWVWY